MDGKDWCQFMGCSCHKQCRCKRRRRRGFICSCSDSNIRRITQTLAGVSAVYRADADLECRGALCRGADSDIIYDWTAVPLSGNLEVVGDTRKIGNNTLVVKGTGTLDLSVTVTFRCRLFGGGFEDCRRTATMRFTQNPTGAFRARRNYAAPLLAGKTAQKTIQK
ncbi:hypothetical protein SAMN04487897_12049 [Paenibacillus sp. yr247]|nr:hypothetical protein SAMN04487897_12049 [Paenibacillus sp. yr247]